MSYKDCKHHEEIAKVISENRDIEDISFEIDEVKGCIDCQKNNSTICGLWIELSFVANLGSQLGASNTLRSIDDLDKEFSKSIKGLIRPYLK